MNEDDQALCRERAVVPAEVLPAEAISPSGPADAPAMSPLAMLLMGHLIPDGELVLMILKPSLWFVPLASLMTLGFAAMIALAGTLFGSGGGLPIRTSTCVNLAILLAAGRLMFAMLQWMGRFYVLTDMRVMGLSGVFQTQVFQCPLRRVARVRVLRTFKDRLLRVGQVEIIPQDEEMPVGVWQTVATPREVKDRVAAAVARAKGTGRGG